MLDQQKIGGFIAERRKKQNMTQKQLAEKIGVSDKAVSKWETGRGMPDNSILMELCELLGTNVNELLSGEKISDDCYHGKAEENMIKLIEQSEKDKKRNLRAFWGSMLGVVILLAGIVWMTSGNMAWYFDLPNVIIMVVFTAIILFMSGLMKDFLFSFRLCFGKDQAELHEIQRALAGYKLVLIVLPVVGMISSLMGIVAIFGNITVSNITDLNALDANIAVAALSVLYSMVFELFLLPFAGRLWAMEKQYDEKR